MVGERSRIPVEMAYAEAIGHAAYIFSYLEWGVVWCAEKLQSGYVGSVSRKTAGQIAHDFLQLCETSGAEEVKTYSVPLAERFYFLVQRRNAFVHAIPGTAPDGAQRLFRDGEPWTMEDIMELSDEFAKLAVEVNQLFHERLAMKGP